MLDIKNIKSFSPSVFVKYLPFVTTLYNNIRYSHLAAASTARLTRGGRYIWDTDFDETHICCSVRVVDQYMSHMLGPLPHSFRNINKKRCLCVYITESFFFSINVFCIFLFFKR